MTRLGILTRFLALSVLTALGCGSDATSTTPDSGPLPPINTPPLACSTSGSACTCSPGDASVGTCDDTTFPDASCCAGPDYPFAGECGCSRHACTDAGAGVPSCSNPPSVIEAGACSPANCGGSSCAGGYCCTSSCQGGACQSTCM